MTANRGTTVSIRILVNEEKNKIICAEADNDFVDILFSFLTLPIGTIIRLICKQQSSQQAEIGCLNNLFRSVENLSTTKLWTDACKAMLLHPRNPWDMFCKDLKVNVDTEPTKYFLCPDFSCTKNRNGLSNYANTICNCGKLMSKEIFASDSGSNADALEEKIGVFVKGSTAYIVSDNLRIMPSTPGALVELLSNLGIKDLNCLEERVLKIGSEEILHLLKCSLLSESPLTDAFLPNQKINSKRRPSVEARDHQFLSQSTIKSTTEERMVVKIFIRKSDGKALYAEAMEDFVDLLFSFLTIPLGNVVKCLAGDSLLGCVENLYKSVQGLDDKWFVSHSNPERSHFISLLSNHMLLNPGLAPKFKCSNQPFEIEERTPFFCCINKVTEKGSVCSLEFADGFRSFRDFGEKLVHLILIDPKTPKRERERERERETSSGGFVKTPAVFLVSDDLVVLPSSGATSSISYLKSLLVPINDIEEHVIKISKQEALNLLKASLITTSALTNVLNSVSKKAKLES